MNLSFADLDSVNIRLSDDWEEGEPLLFRVALEAKRDDLVFHADKDDLEMIRDAINMVLSGEGEKSGGMCLATIGFDGVPFANLEPGPVDEENLR